jgi:hypothetical protein
MAHSFSERYTAKPLIVLIKSVKPEDLPVNGRFYRRANWMNESCQWTNKSYIAFDITTTYLSTPHFQTIFCLFALLATNEKSCWFGRTDINNKNITERSLFGQDGNHNGGPSSQRDSDFQHKFIVDGGFVGFHSFKVYYVCT